MAEEKYHSDYTKIRTTNDLRTSCNGSDMELTMVYRVASINKYSGFGTSVIAKLVKSNIAVYELAFKQMTLEDYYLNSTGRNV